jgi:prepilin-type N-terminal cleavage/methylation domain-containing protein/prepilin-type processing-associated H-X9-DG protein
MRYSRRAFTLVELLVVITIIAMLAGLLLPAVQRAREAGRRAQCLNQEKNLALAVINYESKKQKYPPSYIVYRGGATPSYYGWVPKILPFIERNDLHERFVHGASVAAADSNSLDYTAAGITPPRVDVLVCPSTSSQSSAPVNYVVNCGREDQNTPPNPPDHQENGVFFSEVGTNPVPPLSASYISRHDGTSNTLMLSENLNTISGINSSLAWCAPVPALHEGLTGIVWFALTTGSPSPQVPLNRDADKFPGFGAGAINYARPSSDHPQGFQAAFCDGSVRLLNDDIDYRVYALVMTPRGTQSKTPGATTLTTAEPSTIYGQWIATPLSDADLNK